MMMNSVRDNSVETTDIVYDRYINKLPIQLLSTSHLKLFIPRHIIENASDSTILMWANDAERVYRNDPGNIPDRIVFGYGSQSFECIIRLRE